MAQSFVQRVEEVVIPLLEREGYELVLADFIPRSGILRLFIDASEGITLEDCSKVSHWVGDLLDAEGVSDEVERYTLEVSSPGLDRPLVRPADFERFLGQLAQVRTRIKEEGRRKYKGRLVSADEQGIELDVDGQATQIAYTTIERANLVPEF